MKKSTSAAKRTTKQSNNISEAEVIGIDFGDRKSQFVGLNTDGEVVAEGRVPTSAAAMSKEFGSMGPKVIAIETGTQLAVGLTAPHTARPSRGGGQLTQAPSDLREQS